MPEESLIDAGESPTAQQVRAKVARTLLELLERECEAYCILSGYEHLPEFFETDIDFMVGARDFPRIPGLVDEVARRTQTRLFQVVDHEITGRAFWLVAQSGAETTVVQLDCAADYRHYGRLWLRSKEVLGARRRSAQGFWIPAVAHEFAYGLVKRLNKRSFTKDHGQRLHKLYVDDPLGCDQMIGRFWKSSQADLMLRMAASGDWSAMNAQLEQLRMEMFRNTAETASQRAQSASRRTLAFIRRVTQPTGGWIAIMGPDGAGKSLVISTLCQQLSSTFRVVRCYHLRPKLLRAGNSAEVAVTDPHGKPPRGMLASVAKVFFLLADYVLGYLLQLAPAMMRSDMIIFDRYVYDLLVDSRRVRYGGPGWLLWLAARIVPRPDLVILLDAPAEVLWSRKREVTFEEVVRQRTGYLQVAGDLPQAMVINAAQTPSDVAGSALAAVVEFYSMRTARRLALGKPSIPGNPIEAKAPSHL